MNPLTCAIAALCTAAAAAQPGRSVDDIHALIDAAQPGATVAVPPGAYTGNLRITKPITLDGHGAAVIDGQGSGTVVLILAPDVTFRGFVVRNSGEGVSGEPAGIRAETGPVVIEHNRVENTQFGIDLRTAPGSTVRDNTITGQRFDLGRRGDGIRLWWSADSAVLDNRVDRVRDLVFWYSDGLTIAGNRVTDSRYGLHFMYSSNTRVARNTLTGNSVGIYLMYSNGITVEDNDLAANRGPSGYGLGLKECDDVAVRANRILANRVGAFLDNSPVSLNTTGIFERNVLAFNGIGVLATPSTRRNTFTENAFIENEQQVAVHGRGALDGNAFAHAGRGNFWSDYAGFDLDGDGVGDLPHQPASLFDDLLAREPNLRLLLHSPAQRAVELTARILPSARPDPPFTDPAPLAAPPADLSPRHAERAASALLAPAILTAAGALALALAAAPPRTMRRRTS